MDDWLILLLVAGALVLWVVLVFAGALLAAFFMRSAGPRGRPSRRARS